MEDQYIEAFAMRLYELRQLTCQSARDMSLSLGQSHNYINRLESKRNYPTLKNFFYICEYLKVSPNEFFNYSNPNPHADNELYLEIKKLDSKSQVYFLKLIHDVNHRPV